MINTGKLSELKLGHGDRVKSETTGITARIVLVDAGLVASWSDNPPKPIGECTDRYTVIYRARNQLCEDEGCQQHGIDHVCITTKSPVQDVITKSIVPGQYDNLRVTNVFSDGVGIRVQGVLDGDELDQLIKQLILIREAFMNGKV